MEEQITILKNDLLGLLPSHRIHLAGEITYETSEAEYQEIIRKILTDELFMVVDEELKMMARMCSGGGAIIGPLPKEMSQLIHSEYLLSGISDKDIFDLFIDSMFAATVVGSPVENACRIIQALLWKWCPDARRLGPGR